MQSSSSSDFLAIICLNKLFNHLKLLNNNDNEATLFEEELTQIMSKSDFLSSTSYDSRLGQIIPFLQQEIISRNISCEECFLTNLYQQAAIRQKLDELLCNEPDCSTNLWLIKQFLKKVQTKATMGINNLGAFISHYNISLNSNYHAKLLDKLQYNGSWTYEDIVKGRE